MMACYFPPGTDRERQFRFFTCQFQHGNKTYLPATNKAGNHNGSVPLLQIKTSILCKEKSNYQAMDEEQIIKPSCTNTNYHYKTSAIHNLVLSLHCEQGPSSKRRETRQKEISAQNYNSHSQTLVSRFSLIVLRPRPTVEIDYAVGVIHKLYIGMLKTINLLFVVEVSLIVFVSFHKLYYM